MDYLNAPMPFIIGSRKQFFEQAKDELSLVKHTATP